MSRSSRRLFNTFLICAGILAAMALAFHATDMVMSGSKIWFSLGLLMFSMEIPIAYGIHKLYDHDV